MRRFGKNIFMQKLEKKKRLNITLAPDVWDRLRRAKFERDKPANFLIEQALRYYLAMRKEVANDDRR
jgi:hypothetical protein